MKKIAVVILNWNGKLLMEQFLPSLLAYTPLDVADIVVADNGSTDDSLSFLKSTYPEVKLIEFFDNHGFAAGYNKAFEQLDNEYTVLLNSDVEVTEGWLSTALAYLEDHPDVVALQPKIRSQKEKSLFEYAGACGGFMDIYGYPFCRGRIFTAIEKDEGQYEEVADVIWASGACLFIRLKAYKDAGGLDAIFFAHQEEIDLCWRLLSRGNRIVCLPSSVVYHVGGATLTMEHPHKTFLNFRNNLLMLYKNTPEKYLRKILFVRSFLDCLAALQFLLKGCPANAGAVMRARKEFNQKKKGYEGLRQHYLRLQVSDEFPPLFFKKSLLFSFYFKGKKRCIDHN